MGINYYWYCQRLLLFNITGNKLHVHAFQSIFLLSSLKCRTRKHFT